MVKPNICLCMIVKNEQRVIARCLRSVRPWISSWCIVDTGSSDSTEGIIRTELAGLNGVLFNRPWSDFGHNRTECLSIAYGAASIKAIAPFPDYAFVIDADETFETPEGWEWPDLSADGYRYIVRLGGWWVKRLYLLRFGDWTFRYAVHNKPVHIRKESPSIGVLPGAWVNSFSDGSRHQTERETYLNGVARSMEDLRRFPNDQRVMFYLAQNLYDAGKFTDAEQWYMRCTERNSRKTWFSLLRLGMIAERLGLPASEVCARYTRAAMYNQTRAEPFLELARWSRERKQFALGYGCACAAATMPIPEWELFLHAACYQWRAKDEMAINAYWLGNYFECIDLCSQLLENQHVPDEDKKRIEANRNEAFDRISERASRNAS